jgi:hypothetical protein
MPRLDARVARVAGLAVALAAAGCQNDGVLIPESHEPFLYVALTPPETGRIAPGILGLLATTGTPIAAPFRAAEQFAMLRADDGAAFGWQSTGAEGSFGEVSRASLRAGNYFLPDTVEAGLLSARDIRPGETYDLHVVTDGVVVRGTVTVPASFAVRVESENGIQTLVWDSVPGAAGYIVEVHGHMAPAYQPGTSLVVPQGHPFKTPDRATVRALDPALYRYVSDERTARAGIDRGYGVFGAYTSAVISILEETGGAAP